MIDLEDPLHQAAAQAEAIAVTDEDVEFLEDTGDDGQLFQAAQLLVAVKYVLMFLMTGESKKLLLPKIWREAVRVEKDVNKFLQQWQDQREMEAEE